MIRLTWEQITKKHPHHVVGLKNVTKDDKNNIESADLIFVCDIDYYIFGEELPECDLLAFTDPYVLGALSLGEPTDELLEALDKMKKEN